MGKTSLVNRYVSGEFSPEYFPTIGTNITEKSLNIYEFTIKLAIWNIAGDKRPEEVDKAFYQNAHAAIVVFDVSKLDTFQHVDGWCRAANQMTTPTFYIVCNKTDTGTSAVDREGARKKADEYSARYFEVSAKDGNNVNELFNRVLMDILKRRLNELKARVA